MPKSIVFIDSRVTGYQSLIDQFDANAEWVLIDANRDGISQMAAALTGYSALDSIHIISHGGQGALYLGSTVLDSGNLGFCGSQLASIGGSLTPAGDILLYGCNVARGDVGVKFINSLAQYTGADVAASTNATGGLSTEGNIEIESAVGRVETKSVFSANYNILLDIASTFVIPGSSTTGTIGADSFKVLSGKSLVVDGGTGLDTLSINVSGSVDVSCNAATSTRTLSGDSSTVTGTFHSFEDTTIQGGDGNDNISLTSLQDSYPLYISGGAGTDSITLANNWVTTVGYSLYEIELPDHSKALQVSAQSMGDIKISGFEVLKFGYGGSQPWVLSTTGEIASNFSEIDGTQGGQDTINVSTGQDIFLWKDDQGIHLGIHGDTTPVLLHDFETLDLSGRRLFIQAGSLVTTPYAGQIRYGLNDLEFITGSEIVQLTNLNSSTFASLSSNASPTGMVYVNGTPTQGQTLAATNNLTDADGLGTISYQWQADGTAIVGATASSLVLAEAQVGKVITVTASYTDGHGTAEVVSSSGTSTIANLNDAPSGTVTINGVATQVQILTASNTLADADSLGAITYQWKADGSSITGATASTLMLAEAQVGKAITVTASYTDGHGTAEAVTSIATASVANLNDAPTGGVTISGTTTQGQILTAANTLADVDGLGTISYQWRADNSNIAGATSSILVLAEAQVGKVITVSASYTDLHGTAESVSSSATGAVADVNDAPTGSVSITGTATQGQSLTAVSTLADVDGLGTFSYSWCANGIDIANATTSTLTLTEAQVGKSITVTASYIDGHGTAESRTSSASAAVANVNDAPTGAVTINGTATQGQTLAVSNTLADADGLGAISYQWKADNSNIAGATTSALVLAEAQVGKVITVAASYIDGHGTAELVTSNATAAVANLNDAPTGSVTITGAPMLGEVLTAVNTLADLDGMGAVAYQWRANDIAILGATANTLTLSDPQVGKTIMVISSYTDGHGTPESVRSAATSAVSDLPPLNFMGTKENDAITGSLRDDYIDGGPGTDTAVYSARVAAYSITPSADGHSISGPDGTDSLISIERLHFTDAFLAFDTEGNTGQTYRLYQAAFNRAPDLGGLGGWIAGMDNGLTPTQVANSFMGSAEFQNMYGANPTNEQFVSLLYTNALHRPADAEGMAYWVNQLAGNYQSRAQALVNFAESGENKTAVQPAIANGILYANATQAAGLAKGRALAEHQATTP